MELEVTWGRAARVWWAYLWRNLIAVVLTGILGMVFGAILGLLLGATGVSPGVIQRAAFVLGILTGIAVSVVPIRLILGKDFGEFRLVLLASPPQSEAHA